MRPACSDAIVLKIRHELKRRQSVPRSILVDQVRQVALVWTTTVLRGTLVGGRPGPDAAGKHQHGHCLS